MDGVALPAPDSLRRRATLATVLVAAVLGGYVASSVGYVLTLHPAGVVFLWPPSGIVLGVLLVAPRRHWPVILAGAFGGNVLADAQHGATLMLSLAGSAANVLEEFVAASVVTSLAGHEIRMTRLREVGVFLVGAVIVSNAATALFGGLVLVGYSQASFGQAWFNWWTGDGIGMLLVTPAIVTGVHAWRESSGRPALKRVLADGAFVLAVVAVAFLLLGKGRAGRGTVESHAYLVIPVLILAGIRQGPWAAAASSLALALVTATFAVGGRLAIDTGSQSASAQVLEVYTYLALAAVSGLIPAAVIAEHQETARKLAVSERRFLDIAGHITEAFFVVDLPSGTPAYVSPSWATIWGRPIEDGYDPKIWFEAIHPDDAPAMAASQVETQRGEPSETEVRILRPDGGTRIVRSRAFPVIDAGGTVTRVVGIAQDVTSLHDAELRFVQAQKLEAVGRLAGGVAHDFNNLLTVIFAETEFLHACDIPATVEGSVTEIRHAAESAASLTRQLLAFSRRQVVEPRIFDVNAVVGDMGKMLGRLIGEDVHLDVRLADHPLGVLADRGQIEQLVTNLAVNARDAMPRGGVLLVQTGVADDLDPVDREAESEPIATAAHRLGWVEIQVRDTGTGIPDGVMAHVFEPFFTTKEKGRGTGLGLATCHAIVTQAGGRIGISSKVGVGTTIRITLPRVALSTPAADAAVIAAPGGKERVLLVEDETGVRKVTARLLRARGYEVIEARDGEDALRLLADARTAVDLLLTDVLLPGMSGRELSDRLHEALPEVKTLFASGYTDDVVRQGQEAAHDEAFIAKPFTADDLARRVRTVLDESRSDTRG